MGIYVFNREVLAAALAGSEADFGKHIIPRLIETHRVYAFRHQGYWEDIGTIRAFYEANLDLCEPLPKFNFYDASAPIFTHARYLPATKIIKSTIERSVIADGCIINDAHDRALAHRRPQPDPGRRHHPGLAGDGAGLLRQPGAGAGPGAPPMGIGHGAWIERTIVDKNARIGDDVRSPPTGSRPFSTGPTSTSATGSWSSPRTR